MDNRDWEKDMGRVESFKFAQTLCNGIQPMFHGQFNMPEPLEVALEYWLLAYEELQEVCVTRGEYDSLLDKHTAKTKAHRTEKDRADKAEEREQKLKEAVEIAIRDGGKYENPYESLVYLQSVLASFYPHR